MFSIAEQQARYRAALAEQPIFDCNVWYDPLCEEGFVPYDSLDAMLADTVKARVLLPDGTYTKKPPAYEPVCAQVLLMKRAVEAAQQQSAAVPQEKRSLWEKLFHRKGR